MKVVDVTFSPLCLDFLKKHQLKKLEKQLLDELKEEGINKIIVEINITEKNIKKTRASNRQDYHIQYLIP